MINEDENDIKSQIEQLRANRAKKRAENNYDDNDFTSINEDKPEKKDDGVVGVVLFQCILALVIAIIYILFATFNKPIANEMKDTVIDKSTNDFSFKDKVYDSIGNVITYLNQVQPINVQDISDANASSEVLDSESSNTTSELSSKEEEKLDEDKDKAKVKENDNENNQAIEEDNNNNNNNDKKDEKIVAENLDEEQNGAGGKLNPVKDNELPENATFAPVVYTGRITFPIEKDYRISSPYGFREHPSSSIPEFHTGVDIAAPKSTPIMAAADGVVIKSTQGQSLGNYIVIDHSKGFLTLYGHCDKLIAQEGAHIREGEIIAKVGNTGDSTGNHLHFAMKKDGMYFDPAYVFEDEINVEV